MLFQQLFNEVFANSADTGPLFRVEVVCAFEDLLVDFLGVLAVEWRVTAKKNIKNDTATP